MPDSTHEKEAEFAAAVTRLEAAVNHFAPLLLEAVEEIKLERVRLEKGCERGTP